MAPVGGLGEGITCRGWIRSGAQNSWGEFAVRWWRVHLQPFAARSESPARGYSAVDRLTSIWGRCNQTRVPMKLETSRADSETDIKQNRSLLAGLKPVRPESSWNACTANRDESRLRRCIFILIDCVARQRGRVSSMSERIQTERTNESSNRKAKRSSLLFGSVTVVVAAVLAFWSGWPEADGGHANVANASSGDVLIATSVCDAHSLRARQEEDASLEIEIPAEFDKQWPSANACLSAIAAWDPEAPGPIQPIPFSHKHHTG